MLGGGPHAILLSNALQSCLRLKDPINGHRAVRAGLGRSVNHAAGIPMQDGTRDVDGAALSLRRGAENLTVLQRQVLGLHGDTAPDELWVTGGRSRELSVRQPNLVGFHLDGAAVSEDPPRAEIVLC